MWVSTFHRNLLAPSSYLFEILVLTLQFTGRRYKSEHWIWKLENARDVQQEAEGAALVVGGEEENLIPDVAYRDEEMASVLS